MDFPPISPILVSPSWYATLKRSTSYTRPLICTSTDIASPSCARPDVGSSRPRRHRPPAGVVHLGSGMWLPLELGHLQHHVEPSTRHRSNLAREGAHAVVEPPVTLVVGHVRDAPDELAH